MTQLEKLIEYCEKNPDNVLCILHRVKKGKDEYWPVLHYQTDPDYVADWLCGMGQHDPALKEVLHDSFMSIREAIGTWNRKGVTVAWKPGDPNPRLATWKALL